MAGRDVGWLDRTHRGVQAFEPVVEQPQALACRVAVFVGEVVGGAGEGVDGGEMPAQPRGHEP
jgi:hypothetical protein